MINRLHTFGVDFDPLIMSQTVSGIISWTGKPENNCEYIVTFNVDHTVKLQAYLR